MPKWNQSSPEVLREVRIVGAHGVSKIMESVPEPDTYEGQALRQLAMRLVLEQNCRTLGKEVDRLVAENQRLKAELEKLKTESEEQKRLQTKLNQMSEWLYPDYD